MAIPFEELGLSQYEARAYETLVKFGKATAAKISSDSGVPYSRIYDVMESVIRKGLAKVLPGKTKEYVPTDPGELMKLVEQKKAILAKATTEIQGLKKMYELAVKEPVLVAYGKGNFYKLIKEMKKEEKYSYSVRYVAEPKPEWVRADRECIKRGIDFRGLIRYDKETEKNVQKWLEVVGSRWHSFENEGVAISIRDDAEILISLIKSNSTILIRDAPFVKIMKKLFLAAWEKEPVIK